MDNFYLILSMISWYHNRSIKTSSSYWIWLSHLCRGPSSCKCIKSAINSDTKNKKKCSRRDIHFIFFSFWKYWCSVCYAAWPFLCTIDINSGLNYKYIELFHICGFQQYFRSSVYNDFYTYLDGSLSYKYIIRTWNTSPSFIFESIQFPLCMYFRYEYEH